MHVTLRTLHGSAKETLLDRQPFQVPDQLILKVQYFRNLMKIVFLASYHGNVIATAYDSAAIGISKVAMVLNIVLANLRLHPTYNSQLGPTVASMPGHSGPDADSKAGPRVTGPADEVFRVCARDSIFGSCAPCWDA